MATPRPPDSPPRARLFVALDLPDPAREKLVEWQASALSDRPDLRAVSPEALHVTLAFLGHRPETEIEPIKHAVDLAVDGMRAPVLTPLATKPVPRRRPRLFALDLQDAGGNAAAVQGAIARRLEAGAFYTPERRAFWPHMTIARVGKAARHTAPLSAPPPTAAIHAREVTLYRSRLGRGPARYERLATWPLAV